MTTKEILTNIQKCVELAIPFAAAVCAVWGLDIAIIYVLEAVKKFVK